MKGSPVPPYGTAIQDAIASRNLETMREVARQAEAHLREQGDVAHLLLNLRQEIAYLERLDRHAVADMVPYGVDMRAAMASGDVERMKKMIAVAEEFLARAKDVEKALADLKTEVVRRAR